MPEIDLLPHRKVVFINRFFFPDHSATSQMLSDLAFDLVKAGNTVEIVTSRLRYDEPTAQLPVYEIIDGVSVYRVRSSRFGRGSIPGRAVDYLTFYATAAWKLWQLTDANTIIVVKTDPPLISIIAAPIARFRGAKLINWLQDLFPEVASALGMKFMRGPLTGTLKFLRNLTLRSAQMNVVLGQLMEKQLISQGVSSERIRIIPNWADGALIKPVCREENPLRKMWDLENKFVIGYSGNFGRAHEFKTILDAVESLKHRPDIVFLFVGGGAQLAALEQEVLDRELSTVLFRPYQPREKLSESLSAVDLHLISLNPALEGFIVPSKFYGIAAAGRPSIFIGDTDGEIPLLQQECNCGYSVSSGDKDGLANKIIDFASNPELGIGHGKDARRIFLEKYDRAIAFAAFENVFMQV